MTENKISPRSVLPSMTLDLLRFPLALVILISHVFSTDGIYVQGEIYSFNHYPVFMGVNHFINAFLRAQSPPIYFFISGFFFFWGVEWTQIKYIQKLKNRFNTLFIPYIIWNALTILLLLITSYMSFSKYSAQEYSITFSWSKIFSCFWMYGGELGGMDLPEKVFPIDAPLWYVRNLMVVVLCTPVLYLILRKLRLYFVVFLGLLWFIISYSSDMVGVKGFATAFFFFSWGAYLSIHKKDITNEFGRYFKFSVILYPLLGILYVLSIYYYPNVLSAIKYMNIIVGLLFAYNIAVWLLKSGICKGSKYLSSACFFIYVSHCLVCYKLLKLLYVTIHPTSEVTLLLVYIATVVLTAGLLLGTYYCLHRFSPRLLKTIAR